MNTHFIICENQILNSKLSFFYFPSLVEATKELVKLNSNNVYNLIYRIGKL